MPLVTVPDNPKGLPIATTLSPVRAVSLSPKVTAGSFPSGLTRRTARSVRWSRPMMCAGRIVPS
ncbi:hypothetical protein DOFOFD_11680 [Acetobacteraceae bacterium EV16P]|uniref:Uncharacterized protein n=1 Tax=Sorlinia euscelidii TaxID=3081148 RepID=A0ABU7U481_9PROT